MPPDGGGGTGAPPLRMFSADGHVAHPSGPHRRSRRERIREDHGSATDRGRGRGDDVLGLHHDSYYRDASHLPPRSRPPATTTT